MGNKKRTVKTVWLCAIASILALVSVAVIYGDVLLHTLYAQQKQSKDDSAGALPLPVLRATHTPGLTSAPTADLTPAPEPTRAPAFGDIQNVNFPEEDTGAGADYSYQSDELRIAVNKVQEFGVTYYVADIWMRNISCFRTAFSSGKYRGKRESPEKISRDNGAVLAVNGDFLGGLAIRNGVKYSVATERAVEPTPTPTLTPTPTPSPTPTPTAEASASPTPKLRPERATCVLYRDGRIATEEYETFRTTRAMKDGAWQGWQFGPTLVRDGKPAEDVKKQSRNPRCMIGYYEPGHYCLLVIDGRQKGYSVGMNFKEMTDLAMSLGLKEAYNLDGGGSAVMTFNGEIISSPSGKGDARKLSDMIVIGEYLDEEHLAIFAPTPAPNETPAA